MKIIPTRDKPINEAALPSPKKGVYQGEEVTLYEPKRMKGGSKKFEVYVEDPETDNTRKITFGDLIWYDPKNLNKDEPESREEFWERYECSKISDVTSPMFWSCHWWGKKRK